MRVQSLAVTILVTSLTAVISLSSPAWAEEPLPSAGSKAASVDPVEIFETGGDYVHVSSRRPRTASAHGWWQDGNSRGAKAKVTVELEVKHGSSWRKVASGSRTVMPGGGSSRRANVRYTCAGTKKTTWRSRVDVDIIGVADSPDKLETPAKTLSCGVS
ncbi:hypothetical protein AB0J21_08760 [Streptomyces sp. NPDC049954]|uniref:hypothetical protein n=1 Tax=Streptomyces sp. NPDC049954 TaxID=3155779 RepID=UPI003449DADB